MCAKIVLLILSDTHSEKIRVIIINNNASSNNNASRRRSGFMPWKEIVTEKLKFYTDLFILFYCYSGQSFFVNFIECEH